MLDERGAAAAGCGVGDSWRPPSARRRTSWSNAETTLSPEDEQDPGFKAAQAWFLANEIDREKREEALAQRDGPTSRHRPERSVRKDRLHPGEARRRRSSWPTRKAGATRCARSSSPRDRTRHRAVAADTVAWNERSGRRERDRDLPDDRCWRRLPRPWRRCGGTGPTPGPRRVRLCMSSSSCWRASTAAA